MENAQALKMEYEDYLRNQRGLSEKSIYHCCRRPLPTLPVQRQASQSVEDYAGRYRAIHAAPHLAGEAVSGQDAADASQKLLPVPVQERKDQLQSGAERPAYRPETRIRVAEVSDARAGGNGDRSR